LAKIDKQKEWVAFWKTSFFGIIGLIFAIIGYTFKNYKIFNNLELALLTFITFILVLTSILIFKKLKKEIDELGEIE